MPGGATGWHHLRGIETVTGVKLMLSLTFEVLVELPVLDVVPVLAYRENTIRVSHCTTSSRS